MIDYSGKNTGITPADIKFHNSCGRIYVQFFILNEVLAGGINLVQAEEYLKEDIGLALKHCRVMARVKLMAGCYGGFSEYNPSVHEDIDTIAGDISSKLAYRRKGTGYFELIHVIESLRRKNPDPEPADTVKYFSGVITRLIWNHGSQQIKNACPAIYNTYRKIDYYCGNSDLYDVDDGVVVLREAIIKRLGAISPSSYEIVSMCGRYYPITGTVSAAVDLIFELLDSDPKFLAAVRNSELKRGVYELLKPKLDIQYSPPPPLTPESVMLGGDMFRALKTAIASVATLYRWRGDYSDVEKNAMVDAAYEYLLDEMLIDKPKHSFFDCLAANLENCTREVYDARFKGSFQNLNAWVRDKWKKNLGAE